MAHNFSNHLKAILYPGDINNGLPVHHSKCFTIQNFDYSYYRGRNSRGIPDGANIYAAMNFTIKSIPNGQGKEFYNNLRNDEECYYTIIFNAQFDASNHLERYHDAIIASGYIAQISESFDTNVENVADNNRMLMDVEFILQSITYVGKQSNKMLNFNEI